MVFTGTMKQNWLMIHCLSVSTENADSNTEGDIIISPDYDAVTPFYCGLAMVEQDGKLRYIDYDGTVVWEER